MVWKKTTNISTCNLMCLKKYQKQFVFQNTFGDRFCRLNIFQGQNKLCRSWSFLFEVFQYKFFSMCNPMKTIATKNKADVVLRHRFTNQLVRCSYREVVSGSGIPKGVHLGTTLLAWLEADWQFSRGGLARLIGSGFKKGCVLLYYTSSEFDSILLLFPGTR